MDQSTGSDASGISYYYVIIMPLYYFDLLQGGATTADGKGVELPSEDLARAYALGIVSTFQSGDKGRELHRMSIRDETGTQIGEVSQADLAEDMKGSIGSHGEAEPNSGT